MRNSYESRKYFFYLGISSIAIIFILRLAQIQLIDDQYKIASDINSLRYIKEYPSRGLIYDRNEKLLVYNEPTYDLMLIVGQTSKFDTNSFCDIANISKSKLLSIIKKQSAHNPNEPVIVKKQIALSTTGILSEKLFDYPGFYIQTRSLRRYSMPIAAHVFGYIGEVDQELLDTNESYQSGDYYGISGIEKTYEYLLRGKKGVKVVLVDVFRKTMGSYMEGRYDTAAVSGQNLYTSIDADLQAYGEELMQNKIGGIAAIEPKTGEVLALISAPSYDPNLLVGNIRGKNFNALNTDPTKPLFNRAVSASYPPGSAFKTINALIALQDGVIDENTKIYCSGGYSIGGGHIVGCHSHFSPLNVKQSIQVSCNTFYCTVFNKIINQSSFTKTRDGFNHWRDEVMKFGIGIKLESDITNVSAGRIPNATYYDNIYGINRWVANSCISLAIGQGEIELSPLQLANYTAIIANKGYYYPPHLVRAIDKPSNTFTPFKKVEVDYDAAVFQIVIDGMRDVVTQGTATYILTEDLQQCGKTGTSQNPHGENHSIFICFAPKDNPQIAIAVVVENAGYGSTYAAPIASLMIEKYLNKKVLRTNMETYIKNTNFIEELEEEDE